MGDVVRLGKGDIPSGNDARAAIWQALNTAAQIKMRAAIVVMIDEDGEEFYQVSDGADDPAMLRALEIVNGIVFHNSEDPPAR